MIKGCAKSQIVGDDVLFFGPSNTIGLGSVWRKTDAGGYNPRFEFSNLIPDEETRKKVIKLGRQLTKCEREKGTKWNLKAGLPFVGKIFGKVGIESDFRGARDTFVTADEVALDVILEVPFEQAIQTRFVQNPNDPYLKDATNPNRLIIIKGYRLSGLAVKLYYDPKLLEELKGKYPSGASVNIGGENGFNVSVNYGTNSSLIIKLPGEVYIAGEFARLVNLKLASFSFNPGYKTKGTSVGPVDAFTIRPR